MRGETPEARSFFLSRSQMLVVTAAFTGVLALVPFAAEDLGTLWAFAAVGIGVLVVGRTMHLLLTNPAVLTLNLHGVSSPQRERHGVPPVPWHLIAGFGIGRSIRIGVRRSSVVLLLKDGTEQQIPMGVVSRRDAETEIPAAIEGWLAHTGGEPGASRTQSR